MATAEETPIEKFDPTAEEAVPAAPSAPPIPAKTETVEQDSKPSSILEDAASVGKDALTGVVRGAENAVAGLRKNTRSIADMTGLSDLVGDRETNAQPLEYGSDAPQGIAGQLTAALTEAGLSWTAGGAVAKGAGIAIKSTTAVGAGVQTGLGSFITSDPSHERLSNALMNYPVIGPAFSLLASNPTDNAVVAKTKSVLEESFTAAAATGIFNALHLAVLKYRGASPAAIAKAQEAVVKQAQAASVGPATSTSGGKALVLDASLPSNVRTSGGQVSEYKQVKMADLAIRESDHMNTSGKNPVDPTKVQAFAARIKAGDSTKMPPIDVTTDPLTGEMRILDGRHRVGAAQAEGYETITAKVLRDKNAKELAAELPPLVNLTPAKQAKFEAAMKKLIINDAIEPTKDLPGGPMAKQGTLNADHAESSNIVLQGLKDLGKLTKDDLGPAIKTHEETLEAASMLGLNHEEMLANAAIMNKSMEGIEDYAVGLNRYIQFKGVEMVDHATKGLMGNLESNAAFKQATLELAQAQATFAQMATKMGRGLNAMGIDVGPFDAKAMTANLDQPGAIEQLQRLVAATKGLDKKAQANQIAHIIKMQQMSWIQKAVGVHNEYWTGLGLLSRAATQTINLSSTAIQGLMEPASMIVGGTMQGVTGHGWAAAREGVAIYSGMRTAFFDSLHMAWQAAKTEHAIISQAGTMEIPTKFISALTFNQDPASRVGHFIDLMGNFTRLSFRGLTAGDEFFKQLSYRAKVSATASREAVDLVKAGKLQHSGIAGHVAKALQASIDEQGAATIPEALKYAEKSAFVNDLGGPAAEAGKWLSTGTTWGDYTSIGEGMARLANANPIIRGVLLPFIKTPTNVTRTTFEYTPLIGQLRKQFYTDINLGGEKQAVALGKLTIGAGMYAAAGMLALEGRITGAPPAPGIIMPKGWKPYSAVFKGMGEDGGDLYISYQRLQPFGDVLGLTADFAKSTGMLDDETREGLAQSMTLALSKVMSGDIEPLTKGATAVAASYGKSLISKTYFRNMTEFFSTFSGYNNEASLVRWFQNYAASHVPGVLSQFNSDDTVREVRSTLDAIMARIPGLSQTLPARRDYFGAVNDTKVGMGWSIINPLAMSETKADPVMNELQRLSQSNGKVHFSDIPHQVVIAGKMQDLKAVKNDAGVTAYDRMNELMQTVKPVGHSLNFHDQLKAVMNGPRYHLGKEGEGFDHLDGSPSLVGLRTTLVKKEEYAYREAALDQVKNEFKSQLGIESAMKDEIKTKIARKRTSVGIYDKLLDLGK